MKPVAPSSIARSIAAQHWPDVQHQTKVGKGVYEFSCAGHGGFVGIVGVMNASEQAVEAARKAGLIESVVRIPAGRNRVQNYILRRYTEASQRDLLRNVEDGYAELVEVWVGEEDCDWATIAHSCPDVRDKLAERVADIDSMISDALTSYNADFLANA